MFQNSKSRNLHDISESASDNEVAPSNKKTTHHSSSLLSDSSFAKSREQSPKPRSSLSSSRASAVKASSTLNRNGKLAYEEEDEEHESARNRDGRRSASVDARISTLSRHDYRKPPPGPQKPARTFEQQRRSVSR